MTHAHGRHSGTGLLGTIYGRAALLRRRWYDRPGCRRQLAHRVVSVGNLSTGGTGKTPVVMALARLLRDRGARVVVLTRGYKRRDATEGVLVVSDGTRVLEPVERSGDEPQLLARALPGVPVLVSADRYAAGLFAQKQLGATVSILDDGFQHLQLERDIDFLILPPVDLDDRLLPSGHLREPVDAAVLADALLVPGTDGDVAAVVSATGHHTAFRVAARYGELRRLNTNGSRAAMPVSDGPRRVVAFAGIARPERFFNALRSLGYDIARALTFRDHHWYTRRDVDAIESAARDVNASVIVTTEKDAIRCPMDVFVLPMTVTIEPASDFESWLMDRLR